MAVAAGALLPHPGDSRVDPVKSTVRLVLHIFLVANKNETRITKYHALSPSLVRGNVQLHNEEVRVLVRPPDTGPGVYQANKGFFCMQYSG